MSLLEKIAKAGPNPRGDMSLIEYLKELQHLENLGIQHYDKGDMENILESMDIPKRKSKRDIIKGQATAGGLAGGLLGLGLGGAAGGGFAAKPMLKGTALGALIGAGLLGLEGTTKGSQKRHFNIYKRDKRIYDKTRDPKVRQALAKDYRDYMRFIGEPVFDKSGK